MGRLIRAAIDWQPVFSVNMARLTVITACHCVPHFAVDYVCLSARPGLLLLRKDMLLSLSPPENTRHSPNVGFMLGQRRRRWPNIKPALAHYL